QHTAGEKQQAAQGGENRQGAAEGGEAAQRGDPQPAGGQGTGRGKGDSHGGATRGRTGRAPKHRGRAQGGGE
ncbi:hypothetical protein C3R44_21835, partial [Mycobacterium tuberculosis]